MKSVGGAEVLTDRVVFDFNDLGVALERLARAGCKLAARTGKAGNGNGNGTFRRACSACIIPSIHQPLQRYGKRNPTASPLP